MITCGYIKKRSAPDEARPDAYAIDAAAYRLDRTTLKETRMGDRPEGRQA